MKLNPLLKSGCKLLLVAGAMAPLASFGAASGFSYDDGAAYDNLRHIQSEPSVAAPAGAQGPIRTEGMEATWSYDEGATYDNLRRIQSAPSMASPSDA